MSFTVWFTGLSGSGKTAVSLLVEERVCAYGLPVVRLDGNELRARPEWSLGFSREDRIEHTHRLGDLALMHNLAGRVCLVAAIAPYAGARRDVRRRVGSFVEVHCAAPLDILVAKDVRGLYAQALSGKIQDFTGISAPYEPPENPEVAVYAYEESVEQSADRVMKAIAELVDRAVVARHLSAMV